MMSLCTVYYKHHWDDDEINWMNCHSDDGAAEFHQVMEYTFGDVAWVEYPRYHWTEINEARYDQMLGILPPEIMSGHGFLLGEPSDHHPIRGVPRFGAFVYWDNRFFESLEPMTRVEWKYFNPADAAANVVAEVTSRAHSE